jgi:HK97 family phage major capsid protein
MTKYLDDLPQLSRPRIDLLRALSALDADPAGAAWTRSFEHDESLRVAERHGIAPQPGRMYLETRDLNVDTSGALIGAASPGGRFIASLVAASAFARAGAQVLPMQPADVAVPRVATAPSTSWLAGEGAQISTAQPAIASVTAEPRTIAALVTISQQLGRQSNAEAILVAELARACAAGFDAAAFAGSGSSGEPLGLVSTPGIDAASGATFAWSHARAMLEAVEGSGAAMTSPAFIVSPDAAAVLRDRPRMTGGARPILDDGRIDGVPCIVTANAPSATVIFGDWSQAYRVEWGVLELMTDPFSSWRHGHLSVRALWHVDVLFGQPAAFAVRASVS